VDREAIKDLFQVTNTMGSGKYLGMPSLIGRSKRAMFGYLRGSSVEKDSTMVREASFKSGARSSH